MRCDIYGIYVVRRLRVNRLNAGQIFYTLNILGKNNTSEIIH
jgi:hypothetical protein